jgi:hypothetical protein
MTRHRTSTGLSHRRLLRITKIHEAGHAVGRYMTSDLMGHEISQAVFSIEMHDPKLGKPYMGADGRLYVRGATTYGHMFSRGIDDATKAIDERYGWRDGPMPSGYSTEAIAAARAAGANIDRWARAMILILVAGPVAEGKTTGRTFESILKDPGCENDFREAVETGRLAGWSDEVTQNAIEDAAREVKGRFADPALWNAVIKLATALPDEGTILGDACWEIFSSALPELTDAAA